MLTINVLAKVLLNPCRGLAITLDSAGTLGTVNLRRGSNSTSNSASNLYTQILHQSGETSNLRMIDVKKSQ